MADILSQKLRAGGHSVSRPRRQVFDYLRSHDPATAAQIVADLAGQVDRATVFRSLQLFRALDIVREVGVGPRRKVELAGPYSKHHHHVHCTQCGATVTFTSADIEAKLQQIATQLGYQISTHEIELAGLCASCSLGETKHAE